LYDYSESEYIDNKTRVVILCKKHGVFKLLPVSHLHGYGCPACVKEQLSKEIDNRINF
jgi:hypothetical protein